MRYFLKMMVVRSFWKLDAESAQSTEEVHLPVGFGDQDFHHAVQPLAIFDHLFVEYFSVLLMHRHDPLPASWHSCAARKRALFASANHQLAETINIARQSY